MGCGPSGPSTSHDGQLPSAVHAYGRPLRGEVVSVDVAEPAPSWCLGNEIERPANSTCTEVYHVAGDADGRPHTRHPQGLLRVSYAAISQQGRTARPPQKPNQDTFMCMLPLRGGARDVLVFGVFDGHGPHGEDAAHFCRTELPAVVRSRREFATSPLSAVADSFEELHRRLIAPAAATGSGETRIDATISGCVAIVLAIDGESFVVANVGDSRAILGSCGVPLESSAAAGSSDAGGATVVTVRALSRDHKPARDDERERIENTQARILSEADLGIVGGAEDKLYVCRAQGGMIRYGVLFSRSLGK